MTEKDVFTLESALTTNSGLVLVSGIHSQVSIFLYVMPFAVVVFFVGFFIYFIFFYFDTNTRWHCVQFVHFKAKSSTACQLTKICW